MKEKIQLAMILSLLLCTAAAAQTDIEGTWQGKLATSPNEKSTVQFILTKQADGSYRAVVNSPDMPAIRDIPATSVEFAGGVLTIDVASMNGSYSGTVDKDTVTGEWKQEGSSFPLVLAFRKKTDPSTLKPLLGDWIGDLQTPGDPTKITFLFEITKEGKLAASAFIPEQGQKIPVEDVVLENDQVTIKIAGGQVEFTGKLNGDKIVGDAKQGGQGIALNLVRGKYEAPSYSMPEAEMKRILGEWEGAAGPSKLAFGFRFEATSSGKLAVSLDAPALGMRGGTVKNFAMKGDEVRIELPGTQGDGYTGTLSGNSIKGTLRLAKIDLELNLSKKEHPSGINELPAADMKRLAGEWVGKYAEGGPAYTIIWTFEITKDGKLSATARAPETGPDALPITNISLRGDQLNLKIPATGGEFIGNLDGNTLSGVYKAGGEELRMTITRGAKYQPK